MCSVVLGAGWRLVPGEGRPSRWWAWAPRLDIKEVPHTAFCSFPLLQVLDHKPTWVRSTFILDSMDEFEAFNGGTAA